MDDILIALKANLADQENATEQNFQFRQSYIDNMDRELNELSAAWQDEGANCKSAARALEAESQQVNVKNCHAEQEYEWLLKQERTQQEKTKHLKASVAEMERGKEKMESDLARLRDTLDKLKNTPTELLTKSSETTYHESQIELYEKALAYEVHGDKEGTTVTFSHVDPRDCDRLFSFTFYCDAYKIFHSRQCSPRLPVARVHQITALLNGGTKLQEVVATVREEFALLVREEIVAARAEL